MQFYPLSPVNEFLFIYLEIFFITTLKTHAVLILIIYSQIQPIFIANHPILEDFHRLSPDFLLRFFSVIHIFLLRSSYLIFNFLLCFPILIYYHWLRITPSSVLNNYTSCMAFTLSVYSDTYNESCLIISHISHLNFTF